MRADKTRVSAMKSKVGALIDLLLLSAAKAENDFIFLSNNLRKINTYVRCVNTPARGVSRVISNLRAMDHRLGRRATDVDACAAKILFLNERHGPTKVRKVIGERVAGLTRADDDCIVFHGGLRRRWSQDCTSEAAACHEDQDDRGVLEGALPRSSIHAVAPIQACGFVGESVGAAGGLPER